MYPDYHRCFAVFLSELGSSEWKLTLGVFFHGDDTAYKAGSQAPDRNCSWVNAQAPHRSSENKQPLRLLFQPDSPLASMLSFLEKLVLQRNNNLGQMYPLKQSLGQSF
jgi:hypothetical protein